MYVLDPMLQVLECGINALWQRITQYILRDMQKLLLCLGNASYSPLVK